MAFDELCQQGTTKCYVLEKLRNVSNSEEIMQIFRKRKGEGLKYPSTDNRV